MVPEEDTRWRTSRKWSSSQGSATGPGAAGKPYSSSACRSSSRNAGWLRCATRTTNRLVEPEPDPPAASTHTATCPAGTAVQGRGEEEEKPEASAARPRDRHRRTARRSHTRDGIVIATLHMLCDVVRELDWIELRERTGEWLSRLLVPWEEAGTRLMSVSRCGGGRDGVAIYIAASRVAGHRPIELPGGNLQGLAQRRVVFGVCIFRCRCSRAVRTYVHRTGTPQPQVTPEVLCGCVPLVLPWRYW